MACLMLFLIGCDGEITADLYAQDILDAAEGELLYTKATLIFESPGSSAAETTQQIIKRYFRNADNFRTQQREIYEYTVVDFELPVIRLVDYAPGEDILTLVVELSDGGIHFGLAFNQKRFAELAAVVEDEFWQALSPKDFVIFVDFSNDLREPVTVRLEGVYVNQQPILYAAEYSLSRREGVMIKLSDIMHDYLYANQLVFIGELKQ